MAKEFSHQTVTDKTIADMTVIELADLLGREFIRSGSSECQFDIHGMDTNGKPMKLHFVVNLVSLDA